MTNEIELTRRIARIESQLKFWRTFGVAGICVLLTVACTGAALINEVPDVIKAKEFQLIGADGRVAGKLETIETGAYLRLTEANGFSSVLITANDQRAGVYLDNSDRANIASIEAYLQGGAVGLSRKATDGNYMTTLFGSREGAKLELTQPDAPDKVISASSD